MTPQSATAANLAYFSHPDVVLEYARAAVAVGLWKSERILCERYFPKEEPLLELGCGAGRVAFALEQAGWKDITATDFSPPMIDAAKIIAENVSKIEKNSAAPAAASRVKLSVADATALPFDAGIFRSAIFAFNGFFMLPPAGDRERALREINRVLRTGGVFIFTAHDRALIRNADYWEGERIRWAAGAQDTALERFGDCHLRAPQGDVFIRAADDAEVRSLAAQFGFNVLETALRAELAIENENVREFSDETRFWVLQKT